MKLLDFLSSTPVQSVQGRLPRLLAVNVALLAGLFAVKSVSAYDLEGPSWPSGTITFQMGLGSAGRTLTDGNTSWDTAAAPALPSWNQSIQRAQFVSVPNPSAPVSSGDRVNSIVFSSTIFGESFGSSTLAVAYYRYSGGTMSEADILFNNRQNWDSYRGALRFAGGTSVADVRRVLVHEMGHALGLGHPDQSGQNVDAIMNSRVSNREIPSSDDINGARALYGTQSSPTPTPTPTPTPSPTATPQATPTPTPPTTSTVTVSASPTSINEGGSAVYTIRTSSVSAVPRTVSYSMSGRAINGRQYTLSGTYGRVTIPAGASTGTVTLNSALGSLRRGSKTATMVLSPGTGYQLAFPSNASVTIFNVR